MAIKVVLYRDCERLISLRALKIDASDVQTTIYLPSSPDETEKNTIRLYHSIKSVNVVRGTVTIYYNNGGYCIITND